MSDIASIDKNFAVPVVEEDDFVFYDVRNAPFRIYGLVDNGEEFARLPKAIGENVNDGVSTLYKNTSGGFVRFSTDAREIAVKVYAGDTNLMSHIPLTGSAGLDLYVDSPDDISRFFRPMIPPTTLKSGDTWTATQHFTCKGWRNLTLNFPTYSGVKKLLVGVKKGDNIGEGLPVCKKLPIVFYGNSITQGGCASRPGNAYTNMVGRYFNMEIINLGFSGSGKGEESIANYMAKLPMSAFVCDYDHNAPTPEHLLKTHQRFYDIIREGNPEVPYIMISRMDFDSQYEENIRRRKIISDTYHYAIDKGDKNVYFIDGQGVFRGPNWDACTVDGCHPNDLGMSLVAEAVISELKRAWTQRNVTP